MSGKPRYEASIHREKELIKLNNAHYAVPILSVENQPMLIVLLFYDILSNAIMMKIVR
jgi:hypothetical protein